MTVYVRRASGLVEPFDVPQLTVEAAIDRGWHRGGRLLEPAEPEGPWLVTYPMPGGRAEVDTRGEAGWSFIWDEPAQREMSIARMVYGGPPWGPLEAGGCSV